MIKIPIWSRGSLPGSEVAATYLGYPIDLLLSPPPPLLQHKKPTFTPSLEGGAMAAKQRKN